MSIGDAHPTRVGYYLVGFRRYFQHPVTKKIVYPKNGKVFPIWRKLSQPPQVQLSLI